MANNLNMNGLSLNESAHAPSGGSQNGFGERSAYIPPHLRNRGPAPPGGPGGFDGPPPGPAPVANGNGMNGSAWAPPQQK